MIKATWLAAVVLLLAATAPAADAFGFADVDRRARELASRPYSKQPPALPKALKDLTYDQTRDIRFDPARSLWREHRLPFEIQFFHLGGAFDQPVRIYEVVGNDVNEIAFETAAFDYGKNKLDRSQFARVGFAGFRVHYPLNLAPGKPAYKDELVSFLGASYFRALGQGQRYGASARGLAIDTAERGGEEFPRFEQFWIERPTAGAKELVIHALLDSRRVTGAYRFVIRPGAATATDVQARLYLREPVAKLAVAPLTSMFYFGENQRAPSEDFRPEVHDSDGLSIQASNGEWIWRPLVNPRRLLVTSFALTDPRGFGLMQRDRQFDRYEDLEARYESRPSVWVEPVTKWGAGRVELVQIPTPNEANDNIVAYWVPNAVPPPGTPLDFSYRMLWMKDTDRRPPNGWVVQTRRGHGYQRSSASNDTLKLTVDFDGPALRKLPVNAPVQADVGIANGQSTDLVVYRNDVTGGWRMVVELRRQDKEKPTEVRALLRNDKEVLSETWNYIIPLQQ
jgi:periplasmic glucans biosynthesis protein